VRSRKYCYAALQRGGTFSKLILQFFEICGQAASIVPTTALLMTAA
jgi:hypothetical protein